MRTDLSPIPATLKPGTPILVPVGGAKGKQAAIVSHVSRSGTVYVCKWLARGKRWTPPRPASFFCGYGFGPYRPSGTAPIKS